MAIKPLEAYGPVSNMEVVTRGMAVVNQMTGNSHFQSVPVELAVLKTDIETFSALIAESADGSKKVIAQMRKQRRIVIDKLRLLGRYVEVVSQNDMTIFMTSGFVPASTTRAPAQQLSQNIRWIDHGTNSGQTVMRLRAIPKAVAYDVRYAPVPADGATPASWMTATVTQVKKAFTISGLKPGATYAFQVRSLADSQYSDWSDSVTFICT